MSSDVCSHVSENVVFTADQTWNLSISLQNSGAVSWDEVVDAKTLLVWGRNGMILDREAAVDMRSNNVPPPDR